MGVAEQWAGAVDPLDSACACVKHFGACECLIIKNLHLILVFRLSFLFRIIVSVCVCVCLWAAYGNCTGVCVLNVFSSVCSISIASFMRLSFAEYKYSCCIPVLAPLYQTLQLLFIATEISIWISSIWSVFPWRTHKPSICKVQFDLPCFVTGLHNSGQRVPYM